MTPALSPGQLLDRYQSHTQNCASCRTVLNRIQQLRIACVGIGAIALAAIPLSTLSLEQPSAALVETVIISLADLIWLALGRLEKRFSQGQTVPPRNVTEKRRSSGS